MTRTEKGGCFRAVVWVEQLVGLRFGGQGAILGRLSSWMMMTPVLIMISPSTFELIHRRGYSIMKFLSHFYCFVIIIYIIYFSISISFCHLLLPQLHRISHLVDTQISKKEQISIEKRADRPALPPWEIRDSFFFPFSSSWIFYQFPKSVVSYCLLSQNCERARSPVCELVIGKFLLWHAQSPADATV